MSTSKLGFTKMTISEFETWVMSVKVSRTILYLQEHHTWNPSYSSFDGKNHFDLQAAMKNFHVGHNGWMDIGQHFTTFPDGSILTGRSLTQNPACIFGFNAYAVCIENLGDFDLGNDQMTAMQRDTIVRMAAAICRKFNIPVDSDKIVYHHWFNLETGERNDGLKNNKTCPGTNFFGGNSVAACEQYFLPLVSAKLTDNGSISNTILKYAYVLVDDLNVRAEGNVKSKIVADAKAPLGAVLRVFEIKNGWYKISSSKSFWVKASFTKDVVRFKVLATTLNIRMGPGSEYPKIGTLVKGQEVFVSEEDKGWCRVNVENKWIKKDFLVKA